MKTIRMSKEKMMIIVLFHFCRTATTDSDIEVSISNERTGFFFQPLTNEKHSRLSEQRFFSSPTSLPSLRRDFHLAPAERTTLLDSITVKLGDMSTQSHIHASDLKRAFQPQHTFPGFSKNGFELSAHLVNNPVFSERPILLVLFHATKLPGKGHSTTDNHSSEDNINATKSSKTHHNSKAKNQTFWQKQDLKNADNGISFFSKNNNNHKSPSNTPANKTPTKNFTKNFPTLNFKSQRVKREKDGTERGLCVKADVQFEREDRSGSCLISASVAVCLVQVELPLSWWGREKDKVHVFYSARSVAIPTSHDARSGFSGCGGRMGRGGRYGRFKRGLQKEEYDYENDEEEDDENDGDDGVGNDDGGGGKEIKDDEDDDDDDDEDGEDDYEVGMYYDDYKNYREKDYSTFESDEDVDEEDDEGGGAGNDYDVFKKPTNGSASAFRYTNNQTNNQQGNNTKNKKQSKTSEKNPKKIFYNNNDKNDDDDGDGDDDDDGRDTQLISAVGLAQSQITYDEKKEDPYIFVYVPQMTFHPGSKFKIKIKIDPSSNLTIFTTTVRTRKGIYILEPQVKDDTRWTISRKVDSPMNSAIATASLNQQQILNRDRLDQKVEHVLDWLFEVADDSLSDSKVSITVSYERNTDQKEKYNSIENKIHTKIDIQRDSVFDIVPVVKTYELVNMAMITGKVQNYTLKIYSVAYSGRLNDVTKQTTCHSGDTSAIKVTESCSRVYLDGSETKGVPKASIVTKFGKHTKFLNFQVWRPDFPLHMRLADPLLNQVKGWKTNRHILKRRKNEMAKEDAKKTEKESEKKGERERLKEGSAEKEIVKGEIKEKEEEKEEKTINRAKRNATFGILTETPSSLFQAEIDADISYHTINDMTATNHSISTPPYHSTKQTTTTTNHLKTQQLFQQSSQCDVRFQSTSLEIFATFSSFDGSHLVDKQIFHQITHLVLSSIHLSDPSVAVLHGNVIEGLSPGFTNVQVVTSQGAVVGSVDLQVTSARVGVRGLGVEVVSGLSVHVSPNNDLKRTLLVRVTKETALRSKYQEFILNMELIFDDSSHLPLSKIPPEDVVITTEILDSKALVAKQSYLYHSPRFMLLGHCDGELVKVSVRSSGKCSRRKSRLLAEEMVYLKTEIPAVVDEDGDANEGGGRDASGTEEEGEEGGDVIALVGRDAHAVDNRTKATFHSKAANKGNRGRNGYHSSHYHTQQQAMTSLEIGMYTLLGIFCVAVVIFAINCGVFVAKHRRKQLPLHPSQARATSPKKNMSVAVASAADKWKNYKRVKLSVESMFRKKTAEASGTTNASVVATKSDSGGAVAVAATTANCSPDWVWIGRDILEKNAIDTACSKTLMPEEEFNNNLNNNILNNNNMNNNNNNCQPNNSHNHNTSLENCKNDKTNCSDHKNNDQNDNHAPLSSSSATTTATTNLENSPPPLTTPSSIVNYIGHENHNESYNYNNDIYNSNYNNEKLSGFTEYPGNSFTINSNNNYSNNNYNSNNNKHNKNIFKHLIETDTSENDAEDYDEDYDDDDDDDVREDDYSPKNNKSNNNNNNKINDCDVDNCNNNSNLFNSNKPTSFKDKKKQNSKATCIANPENFKPPFPSSFYVPNHISLSSNDGNTDSSLDNHDNNFSHFLNQSHPPLPSPASHQAPSLDLLPPQPADQPPPKASTPPTTTTSNHLFSTATNSSHLSNNPLINGNNNNNIQPQLSQQSQQQPNNITGIPNLHTDANSKTTSTGHRPSLADCIAHNNSSSSDVEWDYGLIGLPPNQLSEYFDNLKESIA